MSSVEITGTLTIDGGDCRSACSPSAAADSTVRSIGDLCSPKTYEQVFATSKPVDIQTLGGIGSAFEDLPVGESLERFEFVMLRSSSEMVLRIDPEAAMLPAVGGVYPTTFVGGETLFLQIDGGSTVTVTFDVADQTPDAVVRRINAALALAGYPTPLAAVVAGQVVLMGVLASAAGSVAVVGGTGAAALGLAGAVASGLGEDVRFNGLFLVEFARNVVAPRRLQISGSGSLSAVVGGR